MRAAVYHGAYDLQVEDVKDAVIEQPDDAVIRTIVSSMCGSDLYLYGGEAEALVQPGHTVLGHEITGEVVEVGNGVGRLKVGDRVTFPYSVTCGTCFSCREGQTAHCETTGKAVYGFGPAFGDLGGSHAEYVRVPMADLNLDVLPESLPDEAGIFLSCNLPAAVIATDAAEVQPYDVVAVLGCGPSGLLAIDLANLHGPKQVLAFDRLPYRLAAAEARGATPVNIDTDDVAAVVAEATGGRGVDKVIEFVGRGAAFTTAISIARPGAIVSGGGVYLEQDHPVSLYEMYLKNLQIRLNGFANAKMGQWRATRLLEAGKIEPTSLISHRVSLEEFPAAAKAFGLREEGVLKLAIRP
ncbi:MAG: Alcohol dehydrogenase GroES domain protein [Marmoricola sp.]|jgi:threonine dehydrogenase-like Zn-dependent dehydrogenase|nr:Alcohol dehydrogenase GroES domain protein [Marmoricola sp.]